MSQKTNGELAVSGIGWVGTCAAAGLSYAKWHSFWLAFGHFFLSWIYVIYWFAMRYWR